MPGKETVPIITYKNTCLYFCPGSGGVKQFPYSKAAKITSPCGVWSTNLAPLWQHPALQTAIIHGGAVIYSETPRSCYQTCSVCFGHNHLLVVFFFNVFYAICYQYEQSPVAQTCAPNIAARVLADEEQKQPNIPPSPLPNASPALWSPVVPLSSWPPRCRSFAPFVPQP